MVLEIHVDKAPLRTGDSGVVYIGKTRVTLQTVIMAFQLGSTPEQIIVDYDALSLAEVYAVIAYYLRHREEVDKYIQQQEILSEQVRQEILAKNPDLIGLRERLLERLKERQGES
jgi:uncharacterized protein (DUF433 family)